MYGMYLIFTILPFNVYFFCNFLGIFHIKKKIKSSISLIDCNKNLDFFDIL